MVELTSVVLLGVLMQSAATPAGAGSHGLQLDTPHVKIPAEAPAPGSEVLDTPGMKGERDSSRLESPVPGGKRDQGGGGSLPAETVVRVVLTTAVESGRQRNGSAIAGTLAQPVKLRSGRSLPQGTRVEGTVLSSAGAGVVSSGGVITLQLTRVGGVDVVSDVLEFEGTAARRDGQYGAPAKGGEAKVPAGSVLEFHLLDL